MRKAQVIFGVALITLVSSAVNAAVETNGAVGDDRVSLVYDDASGNLSLDAAGYQVSTLEVVSASGSVFTGTQPAEVAPPFDVFSPAKFFLLKTAGIGDTDFGPAAAPGLSADFLAGDITISGSVLPNGSFPGGADMVVNAVPEPSSIALMLLGLVGLSRFRRK